MLPSSCCHFHRTDQTRQIYVPKTINKIPGVGGRGELAAREGSNKGNEVEGKGLQKSFSLLWQEGSREEGGKGVGVDLQTGKGMVHLLASHQLSQHLHY